MNSALAFIVSCIIVLYCASSIQGGCLADGDTAHTAADYNQRLFTYASRQPVQPSTSSDLKFTTFNIQSGYHTNCVNDVPTQALLMKGSDYVGTQETVQNVDTRCNRCNIPSIIADVTGMATRFVMAIPYRTGQYGLAAGSSQTILDTKYIVMTYESLEARVAVAVKTQPLALKGRYLWFINIHVEYYVPAARQYQIGQILNFIKTEITNPDPSAVVVILGDFNGGPWDPVYATMQGAGFVNSWEKFYGSILEGNTIPVDWPGSRFDHIWYRAPTNGGVTIAVKSAEVLNVRLSDHRPYTATLTFTTAGSAAPPPALATTRPTTAPPASATTGPSSVVCVGPILEQVQVDISCPLETQVMTAVTFASYGNPTGTCGNFQLGSCIGGSSTAVVEDKCLQRNKCSFPISNDVFGDPCPRNGKHFFAQVVCS